MHRICYCAAGAMPLVPIARVLPALNHRLAPASTASIAAPCSR